MACYLNFKELQKLKDNTLRLKGMSMTKSKQSS